MSLDIQDLKHIVRSHAHVQARGAHTKSAPPHKDAVVLNLAQYSGVIDYQPSEFVITAWVGTPVAEIQRLLAEHGQYLPFDPLLEQRGATLGGTIATNASGPGRYRYGGVRDFLIGVRFIDGNGELIRGGGKVVKNAAGFDYPKLMVGSLGQLGALVEATFKVFPKPEKYVTLHVRRASLDETLNTLYRLTSAPFDIEALDAIVEPRTNPNHVRDASLHIRIGGLADALPKRIDRVLNFVSSGEVIEGDIEDAMWRSAREFEWGQGRSIVKVPIMPSHIPQLEEMFANGVSRRYSVGGNVAWLALPESTPINEIHEALTKLSLQGLVLISATGRSGDPRIGARETNVFAERVKRALDPHNKFG